MESKFLLTLLASLVLLKYVENQNCLKWQDWQIYKAKNNISFHNTTLELIGLVNTLFIFVQFF